VIEAESLSTRTDAEEQEGGSIAVEDQKPMM